MTGEDIIRTLIELLEAQENIKVTYEIREKEEVLLLHEKYGMTLQISNGKVTGVNFPK